MVFRLAVPKSAETRVSHRDKKSCGSDCPSVVRFYGSYVTAELTYLWIVMEACACSVLDAMQALQGPLLQRELGEGALQAVLAGVLRALSFLHSLSIIHRDVKAANVLISAEGDAKVADLGVAAQLSPMLSRRSTFIGSPLWLSPEALSEQ